MRNYTLIQTLKKKFTWNVDHQFITSVFVCIEKYNNSIFRSSWKSVCLPPRNSLLKTNRKHFKSRETLLFTDAKRQQFIKQKSHTLTKPNVQLCLHSAWVSLQINVLMVSVHATETQTGLKTTFNRKSLHFISPLAPECLFFSVKLKWLVSSPSTVILDFPVKWRLAHPLLGQ